MIYHMPEKGVEYFILFKDWRDSEHYNSQFSLIFNFKSFFKINDKFLILKKGASIFFKTIANYWTSAYSKSTTQFKLLEIKGIIEAARFWLPVRCPFLSLSIETIFHWHLFLNSFRYMYHQEPWHENLLQ